MTNIISINPYSSIIDLVKLSWSKNSTEIAIDNGADRITFQELEEKVIFLTGRILSAAPNEDIIALSTTRGSQLIINILSILNAGKAYLPIDPSFPQGRIDQIVEDCGVKYYLKSNAEDYLTLKVIDGDTVVSELSLEPNKYSKLAYILYTSGSTGKPKGVAVSHASVINLVLWQAENSVSKPGIKTLQFTRLTFDISVQEIFSTLCSGGTLQVVDIEVLRDNKALIQVLNQQKVQRLFLPFVALQGIANEAEDSSVYPEYLEEVMTCGEQLKSTRSVKALFEKMKNARLFNQYGPTECTCIVTQLALPSNPANWDDLPTIGKAISGVESLILDTDLKVITEPNIEGEIYFSGICLADGYLNNSELTKKSFFPLILEDGTSLLVYKTGDLGYYTEEREIFFLGRIDDQVKISGFRVETGEIEAVATALPGVEQAVVIVKEYEDWQKYLELFFVSKQGLVGESEMLLHLKEWLPTYMIPSFCIRKDSFPKTSNGKIDRKLLAADRINSNPSKGIYIKPRNAVEVQLAEVWKNILNIDRVGREDHFFELGGNSLLAQKMAIQINKTFGKEFTVTKIYQFSKLKNQASFLTANEKVFNHNFHKKNTNNSKNRDVAVISTASRFPGASTNDEFWEVVKNGEETIRFFSLEELAPSEQLKAKSDPNYIKARGVIDDIKEFDYDFFGINPKLASIMDPQQRLFLELAFEALDSVGYIADRPDFPIGVFAGCSTNYYFNKNLVFDQDLAESLGNIQLNSFNEKDYLATRVAYILNLKGPAISVNTACSTALVAIATAVQSIRAGECVVALAGASSVAYPIHSGHKYEEGSIFSKDGHCRPFDSEASGTLFSDGGGAVLLKDYDQAILDGDPILAIIKGVGINNDGSDKSSFSAPSVEGQANAIRFALEDAEINPSEIGYLEAHGTATPIGDPIEIEGLNMAFGPTLKNQYCSLGSVKGNVGHLNAAAGIVGFIKTVFALNYKILPKSIGFTTANPAINFEKSPFYIQQETTDWNSEGARKAGVSSFGIGGTNCHVVLEEFIPVLPKSATNNEIDQTIYISANTDKSLKEYAKKLTKFLFQNPEINLGQFGYNVNKNNAKYVRGSSVSFKTSEELLIGLNEIISGEKNPVLRKGTYNFPVFLFPGQGAQYMSMGKELYESEPVFKLEFDKCEMLFLNFTDFSIKEILYPLLSTKEDTKRLSNTRYTQPIIFAVSYSLAKLWESKGVLPSTLIGHSIGEFVAACISGIMSLESAVKLVAKRGDLISKLSPGSMLSIRSSADSIRPILIEGVTISADNAPNLCVVSGPTLLVESFSKTLKEKGVPSRFLETSHAFHSAMMNPALEEFEQVLKSIQLNTPKIPIMSTVTGQWLKDTEATSVEYWTEHLRLPVVYSKAIENVLAELPEAVFIEVGPGNGLSTLLMQQEESKEFVVVQSLNSASKTSEITHFKQQIESLIGQGLRMNWDEIYAKEFHEKMLLPTYAFDKKLCWVEVQLPTALRTTPENLHEITEKHKIDLNAELNNGNTVRITIEQKVSQILKEACGVTISSDKFDLTYFEIGLDSLSMTQLSFYIKKEFEIAISFLQLNGELDNPKALVQYLIDNYSSLKPTTYSFANSVESNGLNGERHIVKGIAIESGKSLENPAASSLKAEVFIKELIQSYSSKTGLSRIKVNATDDNDYSNKLSQAANTLSYPLSINFSKGSQLIDLDGNEYLDWFGGMAGKVFGHQPEFIEKAIADHVQHKLGTYSISHSIELISQKIASLAHKENVELFISDAEAFKRAIGISQAVTQRNLIVTFADRSSILIDKGISQTSSIGRFSSSSKWVVAQNSEEILTLDYGTNESLKMIADHFDDIAAVIVSPVQNSRPEFIPIDYLKALRALTEEKGICLIFDELSTGFRSQIGGFQSQYSIKADLTIYGEVLGGGFPIGVMAGKSNYMNRVPEQISNSGNKSLSTTVTSYSHNYSSIHPLSLVATNSVLDYYAEKGDQFVVKLTQLSHQMVEGLNSIFDKYNVDYWAVGFGSSWKIKLKEEFSNSGLLFALLRQRGILVLENQLCYVTDAHTAIDVQTTLSEVDKAVKLLVENEVVKGDLLLASDEWMSSDNPPFAGAKISIDKNGFPIWVTTEEYKKTRNLLVQSFFL